MSESLIFVGMDVHQDTVTLAVFEGASKEEGGGAEAAERSA